MNAQQPRFTHTRDDAGNILTVIDATTGLEFTALPLLGKRLTQRQAVSAAKKCRIGGHKDWALTSRQQLLSIVDLSRHSPAIDTNAFPNFPSVWFWTSDLCAWSSASAWGVSFSYGNVGGNHRGHGGFALACRRSGQ
ncbi:DUF1566 domain-containing protein [Stenotrophomonas sp. CW117]|uniref:Lcl C-terminal domain-containing protein n=1 Tax=Stenotrophomonas TaxID=40323 RepID=UPI001784A1B7|nr:DUF1566 domain-containing protein [Stenotrophomonas sp. CW117]QOF99775.1 DUF1566 domain-containing protein [Stenotrophomonas sp. CW117]